MADLGDKAKDFLQSDKGEHASDSALHKAGDAVDDRSGGKFDDEVGSAENAADEHIGQ